jgi:hypothetical protein
VSTSRHITQGIVDVVEQRWNSQRKILSGKSKVVGSDPYELRIFAPTDGEHRKVNSVNISRADKQAGVTIKTRQTGPEVRITINSPKNRLVCWEILF